MIEIHQSVNNLIMKYKFEVEFINEFPFSIIDDYGYPEQVSKLSNGYLVSFNKKPDSFILWFDKLCNNNKVLIKTDYIFSFVYSEEEECIYLAHNENINNPKDFKYTLPELAKINNNSIDKYTVEGDYLKTINRDENSSFLPAYLKIVNGYDVCFSDFANYTINTIKEDKIKVLVDVEGRIPLAFDVDNNNNLFWLSAGNENSWNLPTPDNQNAIYKTKLNSGEKGEIIFDGDPKFLMINNQIYDIFFSSQGLFFLGHLSIGKISGSGNKIFIFYIKSMDFMQNNCLFYSCRDSAYSNHYYTIASKSINSKDHPHLLSLAKIAV